MERKTLWKVAAISITAAIIVFSLPIWRRNVEPLPVDKAPYSPQKCVSLQPPCIYYH